MLDCRGFLRSALGVGGPELLTFEMGLDSDSLFGNRIDPNDGSRPNTNCGGDPERDTYRFVLLDSSLAEILRDEGTLTSGDFTISPLSP